MITLIQFTVGDRIYEAVPFHEKGEIYVCGCNMFERAKKLNAHLGETDGSFILDHMDEIPRELNQVSLVFMDWRHPSDPGSVAVFEMYYGWHQFWVWLDRTQWQNNNWLVRRVK